MEQNTESNQADSPVPVQGVQSTTVVAPQNPMPNNAPFQGFDLDALIPKDLREATEKAGLADPNPSTLAAEEPPEDEDGQPGAPDPFADVDAIVKEIMPGDDDGEGQEAKPFWMEDDNYQQLERYMSHHGLPTEMLQKFAQDLADRGTIDNGKLVGGLETEKKELQEKISEYENEIIRLREVEREAIFETLPDTDEQFARPMQNAADNIKNILDIEGASVPLAKILMAKNKVELNDLLSNIDLDDRNLNAITNQWRMYQETKKNLDTARGQAKQNLKDKLSLNIPRDRATDIMRKSLIDMTTSDERFKYIQTGIREGFDKHEHVAKVIHTANKNFEALLGAVTDPHSVVRSPKQLKSLADYALRSAHNNYFANQVPELQEKLTRAEDRMRKMAEGYTALKNAAKGKTGNNGLPFQPRTHTNGAAKPYKNQEDKDADTYADFIAGKIKFDKLLD